MKRNIFIFTLSFIMITALLSPCFAYDDEYKSHEVYAGYGYYSVLYLSASLVDSIAFSSLSSFTGGKHEKDQGSWGPIFAGYNYYLNDNFSLGGYTSYETLKTRWQYSNGYEDWEWSFLSLMGRMNVQYGWDSVKFYHSLILGYTRAEITLEDSSGLSKSESTYIPGGHIALLGLKFGREYTFFADVGFGYLGLINFGATYKF